MSKVVLLLMANDNLRQLAETFASQRQRCECVSLPLALMLPSKIENFIAFSSCFKLRICSSFVRLSFSNLEERATS